MKSKWLFLFLVWSSLFAGESDSTHYAIKNVAIQTSPLGLLANDYAMNAEFRLSGRHGLLLGGSRSSSDVKDGFGVEMNYRHHNNPTLEGGFWGVFVRYMELDNELEIKEDGKKNKYPYSLTSFAVGANFGKRWVVKKRVGISSRIGYGIPIADFKWVDKEPEDSGDLIKMLTKFFSGFDGELSIGIVF